MIAKLSKDPSIIFISETRVHDEKELSRAESFSNAIIGVNNRNLKTFEVDIQNSISFIQNLDVDVDLI